MQKNEKPRLVEQDFPGAIRFDGVAQSAAVWQCLSSPVRRLADTGRARARRFFRGFFRYPKGISPEQRPGFQDFP
jgi:hypothetical protein